jgi:uncharacterized membrane protein
MDNPELPRPNRGADAESLIAGKGMYVVGLLMLVGGAAYFLNVAFANNWISPLMRVLLGGAAGVATMILAEFLHRKGQRYFAEGITGLGAALGFLSLYAASAVFHLAPWPATLGGMVLLTGALALTANQRRSWRIALVGVAAGFVTPLLVGGLHDDRVALTAYVAVLDGVMLALALVRRWLVVELSAFAATVAMYALGLYLPFISELTRVELTLEATALFAIFSAAWFVHAYRYRALGRERIIAVSMNALAFWSVLEANGWHIDRYGLAGALLALAALHIVAARITKAKTFAWLALGFVTFAIPAPLRGDITTLAWALEAAVLVIAGTRTCDRALRSVGAGLVVFVIARLADIYLLPSVVNPDSAVPAAVLDERLYVGLGCAALAFLAAQYARANRALLNVAEGHIADGVSVTANLLAIVVLAAHVLQALPLLHTHLWLASEQGRQVTLSLIASAYGGLLVAFGFVRKEALLRREGIVFLIAAVIKVVAIDLTGVDVAYRVISLLALGSVLVAVSYAYNRRARKGAEG